MGINQVSIDPGICLGRQLTNNQFPGRQHKLSILVIDQITIYVHIVKIIVKPYGLNLPIGLKQRAFVPNPDILHSHIMLLDIFHAECIADIKIDCFYIVQIIGITCKFNIMSNVRRFLF